MKRISVVLGMALLAFGCDSPHPGDGVVTLVNAKRSGEFELLTVGECEYVSCPHAGSGPMTHQFAHYGACKSCRKFLIDAIHAKAEKQ